VASENMSDKMKTDAILACMVGDDPHAPGDEFWVAAKKKQSQTIASCGHVHEAGEKCNKQAAALYIKMHDKFTKDKGMSKGATQENKKVEYPECMKNVKMGHVVSFILVSCLSALFGGYSMAYTNQAAKLMQAQYGWLTKEEQSFWEGIVGASVFVGMGVGSATAGKIM